MKYEDMSDLDIRVEVTMVLSVKGHSGFKSVEYDSRQRCVWVEDIGFSSFPLINIKDPSEVFPIIIENGISIEYYDDSDEKGFDAEWVSYWEASAAHGVNRVFGVSSSCPLRAAVISFLRLNDLKNKSIK